MSDYSNILNLFPDQELKNRIETILVATEEISKKERVSGFHHLFYVPGWIGLIQQSIVENKMNKFVVQPFYDEKNYYEYGDRLIEQSKTIAELQVKNKPEGDSVDEAYENQCAAIRKLFNLALDVWIDVCPEIALYCNHKYTEKTLISAAGIEQNAYEENLKPMGYVVTPSKSDRKFTDDVKDGFYYIAGYILNILILAAIFGLGSLIFD